MCQKFKGGASDRVYCAVKQAATGGTVANQGAQNILSFLVLFSSKSLVLVLLSSKF